MYAQLVSPPVGNQSEDYIPVKRLGQGASGVVYLVKLKEHEEKLFVLKQIEIGKSQAYGYYIAHDVSACACCCVLLC